ncbi:MAG: Spy/CpxP family protein refolding chaperone [Candidatus Brocadiia bacterium]
MNTWEKIRPVILTISIALNVAFLGTWALHLYRARRVMHRPHSTPMRRGPERDRGGIRCPFHKELGVTEKQWQELEPSLREFQEKAEDNAQDIRKYHDALMDELRAPEPDMERIEEYREKIAEGQSKMQQLVIERLLEQKKVLTPEQQERFFEKLKKRMGFPGGRRMSPGTKSDAGHSLLPFAGMIPLCHTRRKIRSGRACLCGLAKPHRIR